MMFTWTQFLDLIEKTFEIKKSALAPYLKINKSTISRLYTKKTSDFALGDNKIYVRLFDPTNSRSLAHEKYADKAKDIENSILDTLKEIIEDEHWTDSVKEIKSDNYEDYVMELIKLARANSLKPSSKKENNLHDNIETPNKNKRIFSSSLTKDTPAENPPNKDGGAKISIPAMYRKCLYCEYFDIAKTVHKYVANTFGTCTVYAQRINSAKPACNNFQENYQKISHEMLVGNFPFRDKFHL
ncbi:MAG: hypothetical protein HDR28_06235 [Lachnospiraceae bacterium]|nr:hypothetical protein [Lachnospiraceae bacterium]MBD5504042.1 hypothetical protein [Lachnospiraceae bacterium]